MFTFLKSYKNKTIRKQKKDMEHGLAMTQKPKTPTTWSLTKKKFVGPNSILQHPKFFFANSTLYILYLGAYLGYLCLPFRK